MIDTFYQDYKKMIKINRIAAGDFIDLPWDKSPRKSIGKR